MKSTIRTLGAILVAIAALPCLADTKELMEKNLAIFERHAGAPVDEVRAFHGIDDWKPLGDDAIAVWTTQRDVYLLKIERPCNGLSWTNGIHLSYHHPVIQARFDSVEFGTQRCRIEEIRPVDYAAARKELYPKSAPAHD